MLDLQRSGSQSIAGDAGPIEVLVDVPAQPHDGVALVAHPQPLLGGSAQHKLPLFLARGLADAGWRVLRPNFRGVGGSGGVHAQGLGETDDLLRLCDALRADPTVQRLVLVGFSFGAFVQARVAHTLAQQGRPAWRIVLAGMPFGEVEGGRRYDTPPVAATGPGAALVVHGECDERVPLSAVLEWARPNAQPVTVVPAADHFFTGRLPLLRTLLLSHLRG